MYPRLNNAIRHSNRLRQWAVHAILSGATPTARAAVITRLLHLCVALESAGNYSTMMTLHAALSHAAIGRLKRTFAALSKPAQKLKQRLDDMTSPLNNHELLRAAVRTRLQQGLCAMTYLALLAKDLVALDNALQHPDGDAAGGGNISLPKLVALDALLRDFTATQVERWCDGRL